MHSSYTKRRGVESRMINTPSATRQFGPSKHLCRLSRSVSSQVCLHNFQPSRSKRSHSSYSSQASLLAVFAHTARAEKYGLQSEMLFIVRTRRAFALNYSLSRHTEYVRQMRIPPFDTLVLGSLRLAPIIVILPRAHEEYEQRRVVI